MKLKEVYPNKGESKKDFISRFMKITADEYPDTKQRYAVALSYWKRRDKNEAYNTQDVNGKDVIDTSTLGGYSYYAQAIPGDEENEYMKTHENKIGEIVNMSPTEYYEEVGKVLGISPTSLKMQRGYNQNYIKELQDVITVQKRKFPMPFISYVDKEQEGLHRMYALGELFGWDEKFPVLVIKQYKELKEDLEDNPKIKDIEDFIEDIYDLRKSSIANEGEYSLGNLVFKELRSRGYLDKLKELKSQLKSRELSLEELTEDNDNKEIKLNDNLRITHI